MILLTDADKYFQNHLDGGKWQEQDTQIREAALQMASRDVATRLGRETLDFSRIFQAYAVYEQALFLTVDESRRSNLFIESEQIEGLGSRRYREPSEHGWSPRALRFIECELNLFPRIGRG